MADSQLSPTQSQRQTQLSQNLYQHPWLRVFKAQKRNRTEMEDEDDHLFVTPTPVDFHLSEEIAQIQAPWGRLYPCIGELEAVDLINTSFLVGRSDKCDITIEKQKFPSNQWVNISKHHFTITKEQDVVFITDQSKNGTFINGKLVGRGNKNILSNDDLISIGHKDLKAYVYKPMNTDDTYLPHELRKTYVLSKRLGRGACGEVHLVFDKHTTKQYAIKKIIKGRNSSCNKINHPSKIKMEIEILKSLKHHFIISMIDIVDTDEEVFIILEYMQGGELSALIGNNLTESQVKFLFYQIVQGVNYLHSKGIIHRDLKAENVLLTNKTPQALIKISDFGLSKIIGEEEVLQTTCGSPAYIAPEVIDSRLCNYTKQVDVWSLGVILYYMLSGHLPFWSSSRDELYKKILTGDYEFDNNSWMGISETAKDLVKKMLTVSHLNRIKIKDALQHPWFANDISMQYKVEQCIRNKTNSNEIPLEEDFSTTRTSRLEGVKTQ